MKMRVIIGIFFTIAILTCLVIGLWFVGHKKQVAKKEAEAKILDEVIARQKNLRQLVVKKIDSGSNFDSFSSSDLGVPFTPANLKTYKVEGGKATTEEATDYSIKLAEALKPASLSLNQPLRTLLAFYDSGNSSNVLELKEIASAHRSALSTLANLTIPSDAEVFHLRLINSLREVTQTLTAISEVEQEPIRAAEAAQKYPGYFNNLISAMAYGNQYFTSHQVKFTNLNTIKVELPQQTP